MPQGKVTSGVFAESKIFPGTRRDYSVYVPAQYSADKPAKLMVFMDGNGYSKKDGAFRIPVVFDNLIHQKTMPVTIAVFVNQEPSPQLSQGRKTVAIVRMSMTLWAIATHVFLSMNFCPWLSRAERFTRSETSRGVRDFVRGICAFTLAWEKPDQFGKVLSHIGSFTNIRAVGLIPASFAKPTASPNRLRFICKTARMISTICLAIGLWPMPTLPQPCAFAGYDHKLS